MIDEVRLLAGVDLPDLEYCEKFTQGRIALAAESQGNQSKAFLADLFGSVVNACRNYHFITILLGGPCDSEAMRTKKPILSDEKK